MQGLRDQNQGGNEHPGNDLIDLKAHTAAHAVSLGKTGRRGEGVARVCESNSNHQAIIAHPDESTRVTNGMTGWFWQLLSGVVVLNGLRWEPIPVSGADLPSDSGRTRWISIPASYGSTGRGSDFRTSP